MRSLLLRVKGTDGRESSRPWSLTVRPEPPRDHDARQGDPGVFLRIAPVSHAPLVTDGGGGFQVLGFELYDAQVTIVWCFTPRSGEVPPDEIITAYTRLAKNGVFQKDWGARKDPWLLGQTEDDSAHSFAWAHIAALAGGFIGVVY